MSPIDTTVRKYTDKKPKLVLFQGSPRREDSCAGQNSKSWKVTEHIKDKWSSIIDIELIDLSVKDQSQVRPCKGCVSTSGGFHCHWPCSCFKKGLDNPDLMYEENVYGKLSSSDGFIVITPIHWYSVSSQVKAMFDRLVCSNLTLTTDQAKKLMGEGNIKNPDLTGKLETDGRHTGLLKNHLEGKVCGFYVHGDDGANDYSDRKVPFVGEKEDGWEPKDAIMPIVYQMRYSGLRCPDNLVKAFYVNNGKEYFEANLDFENTPEFLTIADELIGNWMAEVVNPS